MKSVLVDVSYPDEGIKTNILYYGLPQSVQLGFNEYDFYIHSNTMSSFWKKVIRFQRNMRKAGIPCEKFNYRNAHPDYRFGDLIEVYIIKNRVDGVGVIISDDIKHYKLEKE